MILKGSQRGGSRQLALHLLKTEENEHVEVHEVSGFIAEDILGALREAEAISKGTRCKQFMFHVSLSPPEAERVRVEVFENALTKIEERTGLTGQPRVVVFHEKEGRRHCHAVWSRIDAETMTAKQLSFTKLKLREVSKQLYLEHGWTMPRGLMDSKARDPRNFSLAEWQQAKRLGLHGRDLKGLVQECWAASDSRKAFVQALEERGLVLARGDRRGFVAMTHEGEPLSVARYVGIKAKEVRAKLGDPKDLPSMDDARKQLSERMTPKIQTFIAGRKEAMRRDMGPALKRQGDMAARHRRERDVWDAACKRRWEEETRQRVRRIRTGVKGLWDFMTGKMAKVRKRNEMEAIWALQRDRSQRDALVAVQLKERQVLQVGIRRKREAYLKELLDLRGDLRRYKALRQPTLPEWSEPEPQKNARQPAKPKKERSAASKTRAIARPTPPVPAERKQVRKPALPERPPTIAEKGSRPIESTRLSVPKAAEHSQRKRDQSPSSDASRDVAPETPKVSTPSLSDRLERLRSRKFDRDRSRDSGPDLER